MNEICRRVARLALCAAVVCLPSLAFAQESKSTALAGELAKLLESNKLDSIAARQGAADQFVGALYFPGQLLVVSAKFAGKERMDYLLGAKNYRELYIDLNSATDPQSKVFVTDVGANGLRFKRDNNKNFDTADVAGKTYAFDGDWGKAKISQDEYTKVYQTTDEQYVQMLQALLEQLKKPS